MIRAYLAGTPVPPFQPQDTMRTSRISRETTKIFQARSPNSHVRRTTRGAAEGISTLALGYSGSSEAKEQDHGSERESELSAPLSTDIEDVLTTHTLSRKRKRGDVLPATTVISTATVATPSWTSPSKKEARETGEASDASSPPSGAKAKPKIPARKTTAEDGTITVHPPSNWEEIYNIIKNMRAKNPTAPVDTMGCEDLFWPSAPPREKRYHTLTALMLSSQTKDTVTAAAMQRLHTELVAQEPSADGKTAASGLTVPNVISCDAKHLDHLIGKVGFHNNKTRYIKAAAKILNSEYNGDIPDTVEGLTRLPGVGPKMAYLCMSAAWGIDVGIGVDVHVHRITNLWGWHKTKNPEESRRWLEGWLPKDKWHEINKMLVGLGQTVCLPVGRRCGECDLAGTGLCKAEVRAMKATEGRVKLQKAEPGCPVDVVKDEGVVAIKQELAETS
jgi:endonuclease-3